MHTNRNVVIKDTHFLQQYLKPFDAKQMEAFEVSADINSPNNNSSYLIEQIG